jgi:hypothetical protein
MLIMKGHRTLGDDLIVYGRGGGIYHSPLLFVFIFSVVPAVVLSNRRIPNSRAQAFGSFGKQLSSLVSFVVVYVMFGSYLLCCLGSLSLTFALKAKHVI